MERISIDDVEVDELEEEFVALLPKNSADVYAQLSSDVERLQFIITHIKEDYLPFFDNDEEIADLLDDLDVLVDVNDEDFELSGDIIDMIVAISNYVRNDDVHPQMKERLLIILTYMLEIIEE